MERIIHPKPHVDLIKGRITVFSSDREHRYTLWRRTGLFGQGLVNFICLNPSTADEQANDPTIRRCLGFVEAWGYNELCVTNLFAYRATEPEDMKRAADPVGETNDAWLEAIATAADLVVCAWGEHADFMKRSRAFWKNKMNWAANEAVSRKIKALDFTRSGQPKHPLYLAGHLRPVDIQPGA
jgi:hypothetical protein